MRLEQGPPSAPFAQRLAYLIEGARVVARLTRLAAWRGLVEFVNSDDLTYAASIAYYGLLSLFPFFLIALSILGSASKDDADRLAVLNFVLRYFPTQFEFVTSQLEAFRHTPKHFGLVGSIALIWAALGVFGAINSAVNLAWGVERQRSFFKHRLLSFMMLVTAGVLLLATLLLISAIQMAQASWFAGLLGNFPGLEILRGLTLRWATTVLMIFVVGLIFYFVPNAQVRFRDVWVGAIVTGLLWKGAVEGFSWYVRDMTRFNIVHGSIATVVVFLVWVYTSAVILLYGVEFTAAYARLSRHRPEEISAAPAPRT